MKKGYLYIALTTFFFSTMEIALKLVADDFNPIQLTFTRFFIGGLFLVPFAIKSLKSKTDAPITPRDLIGFAVQGFIGILLSMTLYQMAVTKAPASVVAVLFSSNPIFVMVLAFFILREHIQKNHVIALILDMIGIVILIDPMHISLNPAGVAFALVSTLLFALYGVIGKKPCLKFGGLVVTCFSFMFGSLEMLLFILLTKTPIAIHALSANGLDVFANIPLFEGFTLATLPVVFYICICNSGIGYACYFKAMELTSANETSLVFFFKPILAPVFALLILREGIPLNMIIGILCILAGSLSSILPGLIKPTKICD